MTEVEFLHKALHSYNNVQCNTLQEFEEDIGRTNAIKRAIVKYSAGGEIAPRVVLNHIVVLFNVFGSTALELILHKVPKDHHGNLFPFLHLLNRLPEELCTIEMDKKIIEELRKI